MPSKKRKPCAPCEADASDLARRLEIAHAERDAAVTSVQELHAILRKQGGYMEPEDQAALRRAVLLLEQRGVYSVKARTPWLNRT